MVLRCGDKVLGTLVFYNVPLNDVSNLGRLIHPFGLKGNYAKVEANYYMILYDYYMIFFSPNCGM